MSNTVFVIGAGASAEIGLPTGENLKANIKSLLDFKEDIAFNHRSRQYDIYAALCLMCNTANQDIHAMKMNEILESAKHICSAIGLAESIDNFIHQQKDKPYIAECGKIAIIKSILEFERKSNLFTSKIISHLQDSLHLISATWYFPFFKLITSGCQKSDLKDRFNEITIIVFNYDRCLEYFLQRAISIYYNVDAHESSNIIKSLMIYHPYGSAGILPNLSKTPDTVEFGEEISGAKLLNISKQIKTFTEGVDADHSEIVKIRRSIRTADKIAFLGFAYHKLNMDLLASPDNQLIVKSTQCYGTSFGISESGKSIIDGRIKKLSENGYEAKFKSVKCSQFFEEFGYNLSF